MIDSGTGMYALATNPDFWLKLNLLFILFVLAGSIYGLSQEYESGNIRGNEKVAFFVFVGLAIAEIFSILFIFMYSKFAVYTFYFTHLILAFVGAFFLGAGIRFLMGGVIFPIIMFFILVSQWHEFS